MTPEEAIKNVEEYIKKCNYTWNIESIFREYIKYRQASYVSYTANDVIQNCHRSLEMLFDARATKAIEEIQQYRKIGTVEECREAVEKQKPKKPIPINYQDYADKIDNAEFFEGSYFCPNCGTVLRSGSYCNRCGQKLGWNENLEGMEYE